MGQARIEIFVAAMLGLISCTALAVERREIGNILTESIPDIPPRVGERIRRYQNTRSATFQGWLPGDAGLLVRTRFGETAQIHRVARPGAARRQLTFYAEPIGSVDLQPGGREFLFLKDLGGSEFYQIFRFDAAAGEAQLLTDGKSRNGAVMWNNAGDAFVYYSTKRNGRDWDLYLASAETPARARPVLEEGGVWFPLDFSPDDRRLLVERYVSANESEIFVLDLDKGKLEPVAAVPQGERISFGTAAFAADGRRIFLTSDRNSEFTRLRLYDPQGDVRILTDDIAWDVGGIALSYDRTKLAFTANEDGIDRLYLLDTNSLVRTPVTGLPVGQIYGFEFDRAGKRLGMTINTATSPGDTWVLRPEDGAIERWTFSEIGGLDEAGFVEPELIHYETFDRVDGKPRQIPAFYYRPPGEGPFPVVIRIHGGPESQYTPSFSYTIQYYVRELGIAVLLPNVRGSSGYGKSFLLLDNGYRREDSVRDIGALIDWIGERVELDPARVAVRGGSYGGYMTLASMIHYGPRLRCGVDIVGISNFVTFLENTEDYRRDLRRPEYGDERDPQMRAFLEKISPTARASEIRKPMFIAQGLNDPRVPVGESEQMVKAIRANGQEVWYMLARDEGHGFSKKTNTDFFTSAEAFYLERCLLED